MGMWQSLDSKNDFNNSMVSLDGPPTPGFAAGHHSNESTTTLDPKHTTFSTARTFTMNNNASMEKEPDHAWWKKISLVSVFALLLSFGTIAICVVILKMSDQEEIQTWPFRSYPIQPSVLLSICITFTNMAVTFLFNEGVTVFWWNKALKGSTVGELHHTWHFGSSLWAIVKGWRHFNLIALAHILVMLVVVDGPLLQRASTVKTEPWVQDTTVVAELSDAFLPLYYTGISQGRSTAISAFTPKMNTIVQAYNSRQAIKMNYTGCEGSCDVAMIAPGWDIQCNSSTNPLYINATSGGAETDVLDISLNFNGAYADPGLITLHVELRTSDDPYVLTVRDCNLHLARVIYPLRLDNGTVSTLLSDTPSAAGQTNLTVDYQWLSREMTGAGTFPSTIGGMYLIAYTKFAATGTLRLTGAPFELDTTGELALVNIDPDSMIAPVNYTWVDPTDTILSAMQELMFRAAISASNSSTTQTYNTTETYPHTIYESHYLYLWITIGVVTLATVAASWNVIGCIHPDRDYNLGPFEIAKAFNSPYLQDAGEDSKAMKQLMKTPIVYGKTFSWEMDNKAKGTP